MVDTNIENSDKNVKKEISLLDLLAVLIRRRKLIVFTTLSVFVICVVVNFLYPKVVKSAAEHKVHVIFSGKFEELSPELSKYLNLNLVNISEKEIRNYVNFAKVQKSYNVFTGDSLSERQYNNVIKQVIDSNSFSLSVSHANNSFTLSCDINESKVDDYEKFVTEYISYCSDLVEKSVDHVLENAKANIKTLIEENEASEKTTSDISNLVSIRLALNNFSSTHKQIISLDENPFEAEISFSNKKKIIVLTIAAFLVSILVSYLLAAIEIIKKDPEFSKIISDAWKAGK